MKKISILKSRLTSINKLVVVVMGIVFIKLAFMTTFQYSYYTELANNKTYKQIRVQAPRGEIKDRNGVVLAGNKPEFSVQITADSFNNSGKEKNQNANRAAYEIIKILEKNDESYKDNFPILVENGYYSYTFDKKIEKFKSDNHIPKDYTPRQCFYYMVDSLIKNGVLMISDRSKSPVDLQAKMNSLGYYPPILVSQWKFTEQKNKEDWLSGYNLSKNTSAKEAFSSIRNKYYKIDTSMSDSQARKIMNVRDMLKSNVYKQYDPIVIASGIKSSTVSQIEENTANISGVSVAVEQKRLYPFGDLAAHVLGYVGKIPSSKVDEYVKNGYGINDLVGLSGIEGSFEKSLKGKDGYKEVKVDSVGKVIDEMKNVDPTTGKSVYLTIDSKVQKVAETSLKNAIDSARRGSVFKSQFGDIKINTSAPNAKSGAIVAIDVETGDVIAMSSYPSYDPNKFAGGISAEDYNNYLPKNTNDLLAPNPLLNLATQGAFQPGSTFKLVTAMAALESGLSTSFSINDPGFIKLGSRVFADYVWHHGGKNHGVVNLYKAIQESCNVFFYVVGSDRNWMTGQNLNLGMGASKILDYAKKFGLDEDTGLEKQLKVRNGKVPSEEEKTTQVKLQLKNHLERTMRTHFEGLDYNKDKKEFDKKIDQIVSWIDEKETPGRVETMERLKKLGVKSSNIESDADLMVYSYFNFAKWGVGDTFNLAIGQGENAYNPAQIARYVAAVANGGYKVNLNIVKNLEDKNGKKTEVADRKLEKIDFKDPSNLEDIKLGMLRVSTQGLAKDTFGNFPVKVASKTGTAEKSGKIPTDNEFNYLLSHLGSYKVDKKEVLDRYEKLKSERERHMTAQKIKELKEKINSSDATDKEKEKAKKELDNGVSVKLDNTDTVNAYYLRKAIKQLNANLTDDEIDAYKQNYGSFAWCVAFAPYDHPKIAVACVIPQGESSSYATLPIREVMGQYFGLLKETKEKNTDKLNDGSTQTKEKNNDVNNGEEKKSSSDENSTKKTGSSKNDDLGVIE